MIHLPLNMKYWIFDLDGTLVDSFGFYFATVEKIMNKTMTTEERKHCVSLHASDLFKFHLGEDKAKEALLQLRKINLEETWDTQKFSVVEELLGYLKNKGCHISIFTSRDLNSAKFTVETTGLTKYIDHLVSGDCISEKKPSPEGLHKLQNLYNCKVEDMVMIGDHECDMQAGTKAGAFSVRASWHLHWDHDTCALAHKQFHSDKNFLAWVKETI